MVLNDLANKVYGDSHNQACWSGYKISDYEQFMAFLTDHTAPRLFDYEGRDEFQAHLTGLGTTGFGQESIKAILSADITEERDWAIGEAIAEAWLSVYHRATWPWNMERDKRTPKASLPGVDLIGFVEDGGCTRLLLGEVKTSAEDKHPPQVMNGRSGMEHQLDNLAHRLDIIASILKWLWSRCKNTKYQMQFEDAVTTYANSGNKAASLFGVLIRDTACDERDLKSRGLNLGCFITHPTSCSLIAVHIPCKIAELPDILKGVSV